MWVERDRVGSRFIGRRLRARVPGFGRAGMRIEGGRSARGGTARIRTDVEDRVDKGGRVDSGGWVGRVRPVGKLVRNPVVAAGAIRMAGVEPSAEFRWREGGVPARGQRIAAPEGDLVL